jgi:hypothetical protein
MTHHTIRRRAILPTLAALALAVAAAPTASAIPDFSRGCAGRGPIVLDPKSHLRRAVYCPNFVAPVYGRGLMRIDTLRTTVSWFVCQERSSVANPPFGAGRNHWWLWTAGDDHGRYGWFPANAIKLGGQEDPIPGVPAC